MSVCACVYDHIRFFFFCSSDKMIPPKNKLVSYSTPHVYCMLHTAQSQQTNKGIVKRKSRRRRHSFCWQKTTFSLKYDAYFKCILFNKLTEWATHSFTLSQLKYIYIADYMAFVLFLIFFSFIALYTKKKPNSSCINANMSQELC